MVELCAVQLLLLLMILEHEGRMRSQHIHGFPHVLRPGSQLELGVPKNLLTHIQSVLVSGKQITYLWLPKEFRNKSFKKILLDFFLFPHHFAITYLFHN